jgi:hypothetical protein
MCFELLPPLDLCLELTSPRETVLKIARRGELHLDGRRAAFMFKAMPGQRHPDKTTLSIYLTRTLMQRLRRLAHERRQTVTQVVESMVTDQTRDVVLLPEDYERIAEETRRAMSRTRRVPAAETAASR